MIFLLKMDQCMVLTFLFYPSKPGIIIIVNDTDYDVLEGENTVLNDNDNIVFVSTLHGG